MTPIIFLIILLAYISLAIELTFFHVPSVASTVNLWDSKNSLIKDYSLKYQAFFRYTTYKKVLFFALPIFIIFLTYLYPFYHYLSPQKSNWTLYTPNKLTYILGLAITLAGRYITFSSVLTIRKDNKQKVNSFKLHTNGLFKTSRNPGLIGMYLFFIGIWFCIPALIFLLGICVLIVHMHFKVLMEEDFLTNKYGQTYITYRSATKRYL